MPSGPTGYRQAAEARHRLLQAVRLFFNARRYLEVETPVRLRVPCMETHIDAEPSGEAYLRTSPELHMKRLVCSGLERIYQIGPCFRQGEAGRLHHPEYTMLEWYRTKTDYLGILDETLNLLKETARAVTGTSRITWQGTAINVEATPAIFTVRELFLQYAGWDPVADFDADRFDLDLVDKIEPALPRDRAVILKDYPAPLAALAETAEHGTAQRWELYLAGIEIANAYTELTNPAELRQRFTAWGNIRAENGKPVYPLDEAFFQSLEKTGLPACGGNALGVDRLLMILCDAVSLDEVLLFRE